MKPEYKDDIEKIREILKNARHAVFFGGAGVSTDSGIPDFRSENGLYNSGSDTAAYFLSWRCLNGEPKKFFEFYRSSMIYPHAEPNGAHLALASLEQEGIIKSVITQNIDGLHQKAGSKKVIELHGSARRNYCTECGRAFSLQFMAESVGVPKCSACGGIVRPDVVLYGESLNAKMMSKAVDEIAKADVLIVGGTSLSVMPAAHLVDEFCGEHLIIINYSPTPYDSYADYVIRDSIADVFSEMM